MVEPVTRRRLALFGYIAPAVSLSFVALSTLVDPRFSWSTRSLSSIGEATGMSVLSLSSADQLAFSLFNTGLLLTGLLGAPFILALWRDSQTRTEQLSIGMLLLTLLGVMGVGIAYLDGPFDSFHFPAAVIFFFGIALTLWTHSTAVIQRTDADRGLGTLWIANAYVIQWVLWIILEVMVFTGDDVWTYFAVPEFVAALVLGGWIAQQAWQLRTNNPSSTQHSLINNMFN